MTRGGASGGGEASRGAAHGVRRGGRGRGGGGGPVSREVLLSKKLSWLLRHGAEKEGLKLGHGGFVNLQEVLENRNIKSFGRPTLAEIRAIVADNDKQRYTLIHMSNPQNQPGGVTQTSGFAVPTAEEIQQDDEVSHYLIRANQGHSLHVDDEGLLTPITVEAGNLPDVVVHGTRHDAWAKILASGGLKPMTRNHVHFATGIPQSLNSTAADKNIVPDTKVAALPEAKETPKVLSGMRNSSTILIYLNLRSAIDKGLKFYLSANGVVLSKGDDSGMVRLDLFERVEEKGGKVLVRDGTVIDEVTPRLHKK